MLVNLYELIKYVPALMKLYRPELKRLGKEKFHIPDEVADIEVSDCPPILGKFRMIEIHDFEPVELWFASLLGDPPELVFKAKVEIKNPDSLRKEQVLRTHKMVKPFVCDTEHGLTVKYDITHDNMYRFWFMRKFMKLSPADGTANYRKDERIYSKLIEIFHTPGTKTGMEGRDSAYY